MMEDTPTTNSGNDIIVTDHALVRYLERVLGLDMDSFRKRILDGLGPSIRTLDSGKFPIDGIDGTVKAVVRDRHIVTFQK